MALSEDSFLSKVLQQRCCVGEPVEREELEGVAFAHAKVAAADVAGLRRLERLGYRVVDLNLTFELKAQTGSFRAGIREARPEDEQSVVAIARSSFKYSRFHLDPSFSREQADLIKAEWSKNFFRGERGDRLLVAEQDGELCGFCLLLIDPGVQATIDLIAVTGGSGNLGYASAMIEAACSLGVQRIVVGTQAANVPSVRCYEKNGFRLCDAKYVLHYQGESIR
jgi:ribosomal protein S18 acetylase RimI-like enzyme